MSAPEILKTLLILFCVIMFLLAVLYLRRRRLTWLEFGAFGLLALLLPILGPFLVIALRPGQPRLSK
jgi:4-hydroxybenzoate polyprenyltransferase